MRDSGRRYVGALSNPLAQRGSAWLIALNAQNVPGIPNFPVAVSRSSQPRRSVCPALPVILCLGCGSAADGGQALDSQRLPQRGRDHRRDKLPALANALVRLGLNSIFSRGFSSRFRHQPGCRVWLACLLTMLAGCRGVAPLGSCPSCTAAHGMAVPGDEGACGGPCRIDEHREGCRGPEPSNEAARFHPVPLRPVFAPAGYVEGSFGGIPPQSNSENPQGGPSLDIQIMPPAPVPDGILHPTATPEPGDRLTRVPRRLFPRRAGASWLFPVPQRQAVGRLATRATCDDPWWE